MSGRSSNPVDMSGDDSAPTGNFPAGFPGMPGLGGLSLFFGVIIIDWVSANCCVI